MCHVSWLIIRDFYDSLLIQRKVEVIFLSLHTHSETSVCYFYLHCGNMCSYLVVMATTQQIEYSIKLPVVLYKILFNLHIICRYIINRTCFALYKHMKLEQKDSFYHVGTEYILYSTSSLTTHLSAAMWQTPRRSKLFGTFSILFLWICSLTEFYFDLNVIQFSRRKASKQLNVAFSLYLFNSFMIHFLLAISNFF